MSIWAEMYWMPAGKMLEHHRAHVIDRLTARMAFSIGVGQHNFEFAVHAPGHDAKTCLQTAPSGKGSCLLGLREKALLLLDAVHLELLLLLSFTHLHRHLALQCAGRARALAGN